MDFFEKGRCVSYEIGDVLNFKISIKVNVRTRSICLDRKTVRKRLKAILKGYLDSIVND